MASKDKEISIFWFRRDLRLTDNAGLYRALKHGLPVICLFIFDIEILNKLEDKNDARVNFIHQQILLLSKQLKEKGSGILVKHENPEKAFSEIIKEYPVGAVFTNQDYEPYAIQRDNKVRALLEKSGISFHSFKDQVIFEKNEIVTGDITPFKVYTPYKTKWLTTLKEKDVQPYTSALQFYNFFRLKLPEIPTLEQLGFKKSNVIIPSPAFNESLIKNYDKTRDFPHIETTRIGIHLRHGTVSIRKAVKKGLELNKVWLEELIWRDFFMMILYHNPSTVEESFKRQYDRIKWRNNEKEFEKWCQGMTGFPIVDAGMRQLNQTGFMHNRIRMITASFLTKDLLIDWRWGEAYFARKLLDYEMSSNIGNWQWAAGSGTDAQPYFRIFNPWTQMEKFDKEKKYIKKWIKEYGTNRYPQAIIDHNEARARTLEVYRKAVKI